MGGDIRDIWFTIAPILTLYSGAFIACINVLQAECEKKTHICINSLCHYSKLDHNEMVAG